jgi:hypothetical protein
MFAAEIYLRELIAKDTRNHNPGSRHSVHSS